MNALDSLFAWILAASLRASLLIIAVLAIQAALRGRLSARGRYALWLPVLFVLVMPILPESRWSAEQLLTAPAPTFDMQLTDGAVTLKSTPATGISASATSEKRLIESPAMIDWRQVVVFIWLVGVLGCTIGGVGFYLAMMRRIRQGAVPTSSSLLALVKGMSDSIMLRRAPLVRVSSKVESPAVAGLWRPVLLLPVDFESAFSHTEAALILKHELMHLKRADLPVNALLCLLQALHWFNPLLWFAGARVRQDRESACDAQVLASDEHDYRSDYGHALLKVQSAYCPRGFSLGFVGMFASSAAVRARIEAIAKYRRIHPLMTWLVALLISGLGLVGATCAQIENTATASETKTAFNERWAAYKALIAEVQKLEKESKDPVLSAEIRAKAADAFASKLKEARAIEENIQELQGGSSAPVASVNGIFILSFELAEASKALRQLIQMQNRDNPKAAEEALAKVRSTALDSLIDRELVLGEFRRMGGAIKANFVDDDINKIITEHFKGDRDKFTTELAKNGMTMGKFRELREKMAIVQIMRSRQIGTLAAPTEAEIDAYIETHGTAWHEDGKVKLCTITIPKSTKDARRTACDLHAQLATGADMATLARKHSQDSRAEQGGEWPEMVVKMLSPSLRNAAITTKVGETAPVIEDKAAFIILKVNSRQTADAAGIKEARRTEAVKQLKAEQGKAKIDEWLAGLRQKAEIKTF